MNWIINNICLVWKLACIIRTYRKCNPIVKFTKYEFNNKLYFDVTLLRLQS